MNTLVKDFFQKPFDVLNVSSKDFDKFFVGFDEQFDRMAKTAQELTKNIPAYPPFNIKKESFYNTLDMIKLGQRTTFREMLSDTSPYDGNQLEYMLYGFLIKHDLLENVVRTYY